MVATTPDASYVLTPSVRTLRYAIGTTTAQEGGQIPELKDFSKHIARFGPGEVMDAARDAGLPIKELTQLLEQIDALTPRVKHRKTAEARVRTWLGLDKEDAAA